MTKSRSTLREFVVPVIRAMLVMLSAVAMRPVSTGMARLYVVFATGLFSLGTKRLPALTQSAWLHPSPSTWSASMRLLDRTHN